jgi:hypothetical protein
MDGHDAYPGESWQIHRKSPAKLAEITSRWQMRQASAPANAVTLSADGA